MKFCSNSSSSDELEEDDVDDESELETDFFLFRDIRSSSFALVLVGDSNEMNSSAGGSGVAVFFFTVLLFWNWNPAGDGVGTTFPIVVCMINCQVRKAGPWCSTKHSNRGSNAIVFNQIANFIYHNFAISWFGKFYEKLIIKGERPLTALPSILVKCRKI